MFYTDSIAYDFSPLTLALFFSGTFRVDVLTKNVTYTVFLPGIAHYMFEFN